MSKEWLMSLVLYDLCNADPGQRFSPFCWRARMAMAHKGVDPDIKPVPFTAIPSVEGGFSKTLPVINHNGELVKDSFEIALYLERTFPNAPSLFEGEGGVSLSRFVETFVGTTILPPIAKIVMLDIYHGLAPEDQSYFRTSREARFGITLEDFVSRKEAAKRQLLAALTPARAFLKAHPFLGGDSPLYADYILFGALQWARVSSAEGLLAEEDEVSVWFERCLDLHGGVGRDMPAKAA